MALPEQVRKQAERSDELLKSLQPTPKDDSGNPPKVEGSDPGKTPTPKAHDDKGFEALQQAHRVLQGKYNAEVPRQAGEIAALKEENRQLKAKTQELEDARQAGAPAKSNTSELITDEMRDRYDPELLELVGSLAAEVAGREMKPVKDQMQKAAADEEARSAAEKEHEAGIEFTKALTRLVPEWPNVDKSDKFHLYLAEADPESESGMQRQQSLMEAVKAKDVVTVAGIFRDFITANPGATASTAPPPASKGLESQRVPDSGGGTTLPVDKKVYTKQDVKDFYNDVAKGRIDRKRALEIEQDILSAQREGRMR